MGKPTCHILVACRPDSELPLVQKALATSKLAHFELVVAKNVKELRSHLKEKWAGLILISENFSRRALDQLLEDLSSQYSLPPVLLLLNEGTPGHRAIAYERACYAWFTIEDFVSPGIDSFILAVEKRAELDRSSFEEIAAYQTILSRMGDGVGIINRKGELTYANEALGKLAGVQPEMMIGATPEKFLPEEATESAWAQFEKCHRGEAGTIVVTLPQPDGKERRVDMTASPRFSKKGEFEGLVFVAHDITALTRSSILTRVQLDLGKKLSATNDAVQALICTLDAAMEVGEYSSGVVYLNDPEGGYSLIRQRQLKAAPNHVRDSWQLDKLLMEGGVLRAVERHSCPADLSHLCTPDSILIPIKRTSDSAAFLILSGTPVHTLQEDQIATLGSLASMVANSLGRIRADEYRRRTAQYLHGVVNSQDDMVVRIDAQWRYTFANDAFCRVFNKSHEELIGHRFVPPVHPEDIAKTLRAVVNVKRPPYRVSIENRVRIGDEWRWLSWENTSILDENNEVSEIQGVCRDITEQVLVRRALEASEAQLKAIFNNSLQAFVLFDTETKILSLNHLAQWDRVQTTGQEMREGVSILEYALPEEMDRFSDAIRRVLSGETIKYESRTEFLAGEVRWFEIQLIPVYDEYGSITGGLLTTIDINDRKLTQQTMERSEQRFRSLVQNATDLISIFNGNAELVYQTISFERVLGYSLDEMLGKSIFDIIHKEDMDEVVNRFQETLRNPDSTVPIEFRIRHKEGHWVYLEAIANNRLGDPNVEGVVLTSRDITERRRSEQQLRLLATAIGNAEEAVVITDAELEQPGPRIVFVNEGFTRISGYAPREVLGKTPRILQGEKTDRKILDRLKVELKEGKSFTAETVNYRKDGSEYIVEWRISPVFDASGRITHYVSIQRDITDRKKAEEALKLTAEELVQRNDQLELAKREAEKSRMAVEHAAEELRRAYEDAAVARRIAEEANDAKSQFLANMSHEIRTPLTAILGFARLLADRKGDEETRTFVSQILSAGDHLLSLINDILDLSRVEAGRMTIVPELVDIRVLTREVVDLYRSLAQQKSLKLSTSHGNLPQSVLLDRSRIRQVMTNLVANAIKFTNEGEVSIRVELNRKQDGIQIEVKDSGHGIPEELREKIYEPFFQGDAANRSKQDGTGLGLAITLRIVQAMNGTIDLQSEIGKGTTFLVDIPCQYVEQRLEAVEPVKRKPGGGFAHSLRILVADDHAPNRTLIRHILTARGHEVVLAKDGQEAVDLYLAQTFDVVVLDVQMPRMDGHMAIRHIRASAGGDRIPILTLTAYAMRGDRERSLAAGADDYIAKPFDPKKLAEKIEELGHSGAVKPGKRVRDPEMEALRLEYLEDLEVRATSLLETDQNPEELKLWGHRIAGSGGTFGFPELTTLGRQLEKMVANPETYVPESGRKVLERIRNIATTEVVNVRREIDNDGKET